MHRSIPSARKDRHSAERSILSGNRGKEKGRYDAHYLSRLMFGRWCWNTSGAADSQFDARWHNEILTQRLPLEAYVACEESPTLPLLIVAMEPS